jgi:hypothetical protein
MERLNLNLVCCRLSPLATHYKILLLLAVFIWSQKEAAVAVEMNSFSGKGQRTTHAWTNGRLGLVRGHIVLSWASALLNYKNNIKKNDDDDDGNCE